MKFKCFLRAFYGVISVLTLCACSRSTPPTPTLTATALPETVTATEIPSRTFTLTPTTIPTLTPTQLNTRTPTPTLTSFLTVTPQPTAIPSVTGTPTWTIQHTTTPTFDAYQITTATRSPAQACPVKNPNLKPPDFDKLFGYPSLYNHFQQYYLDYLNGGGTVDRLPYFWLPDYTIDLTNDGVPEYVFHSGDLYILGCQAGKYILLLDVRRNETDAINGVYEIRDANQNGIPEIILSFNVTSRIEGANVVEWDRSQFRYLLVPNDRNINQYGLYQDPYGNSADPFGGVDLKFVDMDSDPVLELATYIYPPFSDYKAYTNGFPWRNETDYYKWNGRDYVFTEYGYGPPIYRFQAVHDGDMAFLYGKYDLAMQYYQQAINTTGLYWYTNNRREHDLETDWAVAWRFRDVTPIPAVIDPDEYPNLAAYSDFRMLLAEIQKGRVARAQTVYDWLQSRYPDGKPGHADAELAAIFWNEYQSTHDTAISCAATYDYSNAHLEELFRYLTAQVIIDTQPVTWPNAINFGAQAAELPYSPSMICPSK